MRKKQIVLNAVLFIISFITVFPFVFIILTSFTYKNQGNIKFGIDAYRYIFENSRGLLEAFGVTILYSAVTVFLGLILTSMLAYAVSRKKMIFVKGIHVYLYIAAVFAGTTVSSYILITNYLNIDDTIWVYILPYAVNPWYVFLIAVMLKEIPQNIAESAMMDGAGEMRIFFSVILPVLKPVLVCVGIFIFLPRWNDWLTCVLYINNDKLFNIRYYIQEIAENQSAVKAAGLDITEQVRLATVAFSAVPVFALLFVFKKYFTGGIVCGKIK